MEISARLHSSFRSYFSDESHLAFYGCHPLKPTTSLPASSSSSSASLAILRAVAMPTLTPITACNSYSSISLELALIKELADLKVQVKIKKKQLRAVAKERKKALKQKGAKSKNGSSSSSSSSSNSLSASSDGEREATTNMKHLEQSISQFTADKQCAFVESKQWNLNIADAEQNSLERLGSYEMSVQTCKEDAICGAVELTCAGRVEVCVGGKCKRAGSEKLLSSMKARLGRNTLVETVGCKCMGRCASAMNLKVMKEDTNPQHHSHASVDDAGLILRHHFGLGPPPSGLRAFQSKLSTTSNVAS